MSEAENKSDKCAEQCGEPLFMTISPTDTDLQAAYDEAAATIPRFIEEIQHGEDALCSAKLRFRDPEESERLGEDRFVFLWLGLVRYETADRRFSGTFFEVPSELEKWHSIGQRLIFDPDQIFDWMVLRDGHLHGGFTIRVTRSRVPEREREAYDRYIGASVYEPLPIHGVRSETSC